MTTQQTATQVFTLQAAANITQKRFIGWNDQMATAGVPIKCVSDHNIASGDSGRVIWGITAMVESGAAVDGVEPRLMSDAQGRAVPWTTGNTVAARFKRGQTATAAGQLIEVFVLPS